MAKLPVTVQLFYNGQWNTAPVYARDPIQITRGSGDEQSESTPSTVTWTLDNRDGKYSPRNPTSLLFGLIGRNTSARVSIGEPHVGAANKDTVAATSHVAPSVTAAKAGLLVCAWFGVLAAEAYTLPGPMTAGPSTASVNVRMASAREAVSAGASGTRTATVSIARSWVAASVLLHGTSITVQETLSAFGQDDDLTVTTATGTQAGWWLVAVQGWRILPQERARFMPDAPNDNTGGWVLLAGSDVNRVSSFNHQQVRVWARRVDVAGAQAVTFFGSHPLELLDNNDHHAHLYVLSGVDNWQPRAHVEIPAWPQRWDVSGTDVFVPLKGAGLLRRLGQGQDPLQSPIRRTVTGDLMASLDPGSGVGTLVPVAYWPLEDGQDSSLAASGLPGGQPMRQSGGKITFGTVDGPGGSAPLPDMFASTGNLRGPVSGLTATNDWVVSFVVQFTGTGTWTALELLLTGGPYPRLELRLSTTVALFGIDVAGVATSEGLLAVDMSDGRWYWCELRCVVAARGTVFWMLRVRAEDGQFLAGSLHSFTPLGNVVGTATGPITGVVVHARAAGTAASLGHVMVWPRDENEPRNLVLAAFDGYLSETAGRRLERLCDEEMIIFHPVGGLDATAAMGPQSTGTLLAVLRECEVADLGILYEPREALGLAYRTQGSVYNQAATLALTYGATGEVAPPLEPTPDDFALRNDVMVTRAHGATTGGSARAVRDTGSLAVATVGRYSDNPRINVASDGALPDQAGWRLHLGTVDEDRFPGVRVSLTSLGAAGKQTLADAAAALDLGDRLSIASPPAWLPPETISQVAVGATEVLAPFEWDLVLNTAPESPYRIAEVAHATQSVLGSDSALLNEALDTTETGVDIICGAGPDWVRELNFDIMIGGERMTVTAVAAMAGTFPSRTTTLTVTRSVNSVVKTHATGAAVAMFPLVYIGL